MAASVAELDNLDSEVQVWREHAAGFAAEQAAMEPYRAQVRLQPFDKAEHAARVRFFSFFNPRARA